LIVLFIVCNEVFLVPFQMKQYENEFDLLNTEKQACLDVLMRCKAEETRCKLFIESIAKKQKEIVSQDEAIHKV
jgi:hypothetical protein